MQQISPSFSQLTSANLSPGLILAFSLKSFGSTIWPLSSMLIRDSTLQQLEFVPAGAKHPPLSFLTIVLPPSQICSSPKEFQILASEE
jgi:hypothetical protein